MSTRRIPLARSIETFVRVCHSPDRLGTTHLVISKVSCGGRNLTLETAPRPEILPLVTNRIIALKRPYIHYRVWFA